MDEQRLDGHKKVLGILYIVSALLSILLMLVFTSIIEMVYAFALNEADPEEQRIAGFILSLVGMVPWIVIALFGVPGLIAGIGLVTRQGWSLILALIVGCFKLFSFPIGTAIGVYAIWIYSEDQKLKSASPVNNPPSAVR